MGITSLQARMDSLDWLQQGSISEENAGLMDSNTLVGNPPVWPHDPDILLCGRPPATRRLPPHHDQALKCPRCDSAHTKFCYYNNYSLSQPRYFCKTCRRYWTKGGTLRNIPVGGGCRKNKKISSNPKKTPSTSSHSSVSHASAQDPTGRRRPGPSPPPVLDSESTNLQLAFPEQLSLSAGNVPGLFNPMSTGLFFDDVFMGTQQNPGVNNGFNGIGVNNHAFGTSSLEGGIDNPGEGLSIMESCQRLMLPYNENNYPGYNNNSNHLHHHEVDVKPKVLSMEWHDCNSGSGIKDPFGYNIGGLGSWAGLMNGYGPSATNPLV